MLRGFTTKKRTEVMFHQEVVIIVFCREIGERLRPHAERKKLMFNCEVVTINFSSRGRPGVEGRRMAGGRYVSG